MALSRHVRFDLRDRSISSQLGTFWLPEHPDVPVQGVLDVDADGISLRLHGRLRPNQDSPTGRLEDTHHPVIHGQLENPGTLCTLLRSRGWFENTRFAALESAACVRDAHIAAGELVSQVRIQFDGSHILSPQAFQVDFPAEVEERHAGIRGVHVTGGSTMTVSAPGLKIRIRPAVSYGGGQSSIEALRVASITAELAPALPVDEAIDSVHLPMRQLLAVLRGSNAELLSVQVLPESGNLSDRNVTLDELPLDIDVPYLSVGGAHVVDLGYDAYRFETLEAREFGLAGSDPSETLVQLVRSWYHAFADETVREACEAANRTATLSGRTAVELFADYFAAVETLAGALEPDHRAHEERVDRLMSYIPDGDTDRTWADTRLRTGKGWGQKQALTELAKATTFVDKFVDSPFIATCVSQRGKYSHGRPPPRDVVRTAARLRAWFVLRTLQLGGADSEMSERFATRMSSRLKD